MVPRSASSSPATIRISVVFPAPFSPTRPTISPGCTSSETSSTARVGPNDFETFAIRSTASELPARHLELPAPDLRLHAFHLGHRFGARLQLVVPDQRDDAFVHAHPVDGRLELLIVNEAGHVAGSE